MKIRNKSLVWVALLAFIAGIFGAAPTSAQAQALNNVYQKIYTSATPASAGTAGSTTGTGGTLVDVAGSVWSISNAGICDVNFASRGSGGTDGTYALSPTGGTGITGFAGTYTVLGGTVVSTNITGTGTYVTAYTGWSWTAAGFAVAPSATPVLSPNVLHSAGVTDSNGDTNQALLPSSFSTTTQEADEWFIDSNSAATAFPECRYQGTNQFYQLDATSGNQFIRYRNNGANTNLTTNGGVALVVGHVYLAKLNCTGSSPTVLTGELWDYGPYSAFSPGVTVGTRIWTATVSDSTPAVQGAGQMAIGANTTRNEAFEVDFYATPGIAITPGTGGFGQNYSVTVTRQGGSAYTPGTPGSPAFTVTTSSGASVSGQVVTNGTTATFTLFTGAPTTTPATTVTLTITDTLNGYTQTFSVQPISLGVCVNAGSTSTSNSVACGVPQFGVAPYTLQLLKSTDGGVTYNTVSGSAATCQYPGGSPSNLLVDASATSRAFCFYKVRATDSAGTPQVVTGLPVGATALDTVVPFANLIFIGDSTTAGTDSTTGITGSGQIGNISIGGGSSWPSSTPINFSGSPITPATPPSITLGCSGGKPYVVSFTSGSLMTALPYMPVTGDGATCVLSGKIVAGKLVACWVVSSTGTWTSASCTPSCVPVANVIGVGGLAHHIQLIYAGSGITAQPGASVSGVSGSPSVTVQGPVGGQPFTCAMAANNLYGGLRSFTAYDFGYSGSATSNWTPGLLLNNALALAATLTGPTLFVVQLGVNDAKSSAGPVSASTYQTNLTACLSAIAAAGWPLVVNQPLYLNQYASDQTTWNESSMQAMASYQLKVQFAINATNTLYSGKAFLGTSLGWDVFAGNPNLQVDGAHPNDFGYMAMGTLVAPTVFTPLGIPTQGGPTTNEPNGHIGGPASLAKADLLSDYLPGGKWARVRRSTSPQAITLAATVNNFAFAH